MVQALNQHVEERSTTQAREPSTLYMSSLYSKYDTELQTLSRSLRDQYHAMQAAGHGATFSDVEGEIMYLLIREERPTVVFEVSPNAGWSTNYILAALTANKHGAVHSFELQPTIGGKPTERVIRDNQCAGWDQNRLVFHLGDARTTTTQVAGPIGFLLVDSCHEAAFARWYIEHLFPRVVGFVLIQDIAFVNRLEFSTEAPVVWHWAAHHRVAVQLSGIVEQDLARAGVRATYAQRRPLQSNSVFFRWPQVDAGPVPHLLHDPIGARPELQTAIASAYGDAADDSLNSLVMSFLWSSDVSTRRQRDLFFTVPAGDIQTAITAGHRDLADSLLNRLVSDLFWSPNIACKHRDFVFAASAYLALGNRGEADRCFRRALGCVVGEDQQQRARSLVELLRPYVRFHQWRLLAITCAFILLERGAGRVLFAKMLKRRPPRPPAAA